jgi:hypothetical protein
MKKQKKKEKNENKGGGETYQEERGLKGKRVKGWKGEVTPEGNEEWGPGGQGDV